MIDQVRRLQLGDDLARRLASAIRGAQLYAPSHPLVGRNLAAFGEVLAELHGDVPAVTIGFVGDDVVVCDLPLPKPLTSIVDLGRRLRARGIERLTVDRGADGDELRTLVHYLAEANGTNGERGASAKAVPELPHVRIGRISIEQRVEANAADTATIRRLYADAVSAVENIWEGARQELKIDARAAQGIVQGLAQAVAQNRSALLALTAVKNYDNYTFTHMVNVSILTMAQARSLGVDGALLREFGLAALMHDIGKVRVPAEILQKPDRLSERELAILRRHPIDGAEILRRTPDVAALAPIVAFEHHLRLDGGGYPPVARASLNVATVLTSIADVYDAMRSQRVYQQVFPSERVVEVLRRNDGRQFDQHLIRRFVQLLGIYPTGTAVRLDTGEVAIVTRVNTGDPHRSRVRVVMDRQGVSVEQPYELDLWVPSDEAGTPTTISAPLDADALGVDAVAHV
jgi:putative nucleotidyltransferase with HDIG domain